MPIIDIPTPNSTMEAMVQTGQPSSCGGLTNTPPDREEKTVTQWLDTAKAIGFDVAVWIDPQKLVAREDVRSLCAENKCGAYHKNWTCPPAVGSITQCQQKMKQYHHGILVQSIGHANQHAETQCYRRTELRHTQQFYTLVEAIRRVHPNALCLGTGGCRVCQICAYPEPCRFPDHTISSMEGYGLFVAHVCRDAGVPYQYGETTVTLTACILL